MAEIPLEAKFYSADYNNATQVIHNFEDELNGYCNYSTYSIANYARKVYNSSEGEALKIICARLDMYLEVFEKLKQLLVVVDGLTSSNEKVVSAMCKDVLTGIELENLKQKKDNAYTYWHNYAASNKEAALEDYEIINQIIGAKWKYEEANKEYNIYKVHLENAIAADKATPVDNTTGEKDIISYITTSLNKIDAGLNSQSGLFN